MDVVAGLGKVLGEQVGLRVGVGIRGGGLARKVALGECIGVGAVEGPSPADAGDVGPRGGLLEGGGWVVPEDGQPILPREVQEGPGPLGQGDLED